MNQEIIQSLRAAFPFEQIETKIQVTSGDKTKGLAIFYLDARSVQERLDTLLGPLNWKNHYYPWQNNAQLCGISIFDAERNIWIEKQDGAENSDIEPVKGGLTDAFKRAAVLWGVGRYLYEIEGVWVEVEQRGKGSYIKDNQKGKLKTEYDKAVARIFGTSAPQSSTPANAPNKSTQLAQTQESITPPPIPSNANDNQPSAPSVPEFQVRSVKPSGKSSQMVELVDNCSGELLTAYIKASDNTIAVGSCLRNVQVIKKDSTYGPYNLVTAYEAA